jgi:hypothetical protein
MPQLYIDGLPGIAQHQIAGNTDGVTAPIRTGTYVLAGGNNITLSQDVNTVYIIGGAGGTGGGGSINISAGTTSRNLTNFVLSDSNGISFGLNGSTITASHNGLTSQSNQAFSADGGSSAFQTLVFRNANGISFSNSNGSVQASYTVPTQTNQTLGVYHVGNTTGQSSSSTVDARSVSIDGAGIISAGWSAGSIRISATQSNQAFSAGAASSTFQTLSFQDSNGISFSNNAGAIRLTHDLQFTSATSAITSNALHSSASRVFNVVAATNNTGGGTASLSSNVSFSAANGLTFYTSAGNAIVGSYTVPTVPAQFSGGLSNVGNTVGDTGVVTGRLVLAGGDNVTLSGSTNGGSMTVTISAAAGGPGGGGPALSAGTQSVSTGTVLFADSNGISFGMSGSSRITASYTVPSIAGLLSNINLSAGTTSQNLSNFVFSNSNGISFGLNGSTVTASYTVPSQSNQTGGIYVTAQSTGQSSSSTYDLRTLSIVPDGIISAGWSNGSFRISATQSNQAFSAGGGSSTFQTLSFSNANGISFTNTNGQVGASYTVPGTLSVYAQSNTTQSSSGTIPFNSLQFAGAGVASVGVTNGSVVVSVPAGGGGETRLTAYAQSNTTQSSSGTIALSSLNFAGAGIASVGITNGSVVVSVPSGGGAGDGGVFAGVSDLGNTAGSTGTVSTGNFVLVGSNGVTLSQSTGAAGSAATVTVQGYPNLSAWLPYKNAPMVIGGDQNQSLMLAPHVINAPVQFDRVVFPIFYSQATNSTLTVSRTVYWGIFTKNGASMSLVWSASGSYSINGSGTASSSANSGIRIVSFGQTTTITPGNYYLGVVFRSSTAGANATAQILFASEINSSISGYIGVGSVTNQPWQPGLGYWISTSSGIPNSLAFTDIRANSSQFNRPPMVLFTSGTT